MQILIAGPGEVATPLAVTMRTPGHDFELAAGFVLTEGVADRAGIVSVDYCEAVDRSDPTTRYNHVTVRLATPCAQDRAGRPTDGNAPDRHFIVSASCGMCGKTTIDQVEAHCPPVAAGSPFPGRLIPLLPDRLRQAQKAFDRTGGLHAAGLFGRDGHLHWAREDVGRHNAVDKVIGATMLHGQGVEPGDLLLAVSGRVSFEIVQKAAAAGIGLIAAVSAPSSLAVSAADRLGVVLAAFVRAPNYNVYTHPDRIDFEA